MIRSVMSKPVNGLYQFTYPLDSGAATGMWHIRASAGDNQPREWDFHVEDFMPERMAPEPDAAGRASRAGCRRHLWR